MLMQEEERMSDHFAGPGEHDFVKSELDREQLASREKFEVIMHMDSRPTTRHAGICEPVNRLGPTS